MNYTPLSFEDLNTYLMPQQLQALATQGQEPTCPNFVQKILHDVTTRIRAEVATAYPNQHPISAHTIPNVLKPAGAHLAIEALVGRLPGLSLTQDQINNARAARHMLQRVAEGKLALQSTDNLAAIHPQASSLQLCQPSGHTLTRARLSHL